MELVRIAMQAYGAGDHEIVVAMADPMMRWDERAVRPDGELVWGRDAVLEAMHARHRGTAQERGFVLEELIDAGDAGVIAVFSEGLSERAGGAGGELAAAEHHAALWTFEGTTIVGCAIYLSRQEALRALQMAVPEPPPPAAANPERARPKGPAETPPAPKRRSGRPRRKPAGRKDAQGAGPLQPGSDDWEQRRAAAKRRAALRRAARQRKAS